MTPILQLEFLYASLMFYNKVSKVKMDIFLLPFIGYLGFKIIFLCL